MKNQDRNPRVRAIANLFPRTIEWSDADGVFLGSAPPLTGYCCHGKTPESVAAELEEIILEWSRDIFEGEVELSALRCEPFASRIAAIRTAPETAIATPPPSPPSRNRTPRRRPAVCGSRGARAMKLAAA